jgi:hypothetical protein
MRYFCSVLFLALGLSSAAMAQDTAPEIRQFDIPTLEKLGHDMYAQDQMAWHATDALFALHPQAELVAEKVQGWIVEDRPDGALVRFIRLTDNGPEAAYDVDMAGAKPAISIPQDRVLSDSEKAQYAARSLAIKSVTQRCGDNYNTVVLKDPQGPGWLAWALAATTNPNLVMAGGHHRLTVSADGSQVLRMDALSRTCAVMQKSGGPNGSKVAALMATQLVSNMPVETFVFLSLEHQLPIFVVTPDRTIWKIADGRIGSLGTVPEKKTP